jgi:hypothetical protein
MEHYITAMLIYEYMLLYIDVKTRSRPHNITVLYCILQFPLRFYIQPDDGYICIAETCSSFYM